MNLFLYSQEKIIERFNKTKGIKNTKYLCTNIGLIIIDNKSPDKITPKITPGVAPGASPGVTPK
jgi:hypothetical protein